MTEDIVFSVGYPVLSNAENGRITEALDEIEVIQRYQISVSLGELTVPNVPINEAEEVRKAIQGLQILGGDYTFSERR